MYSFPIFYYQLSVQNASHLPSIPDYPNITSSFGLHNFEYPIMCSNYYEITIENLINPIQFMENFNPSQSLEDFKVETPNSIFMNQRQQLQSSQKQLKVKVQHFKNDLFSHLNNKQSQKDRQLLKIKPADLKQKAKRIKQNQNTGTTKQILKNEQKTHQDLQQIDNQLFEFKHKDKSAEGAAYESNYPKKNTQSNLINQIFSFISTQQKSIHVLKRYLGQSPQKVKAFYQILLLIKKRKKKYCNRKYFEGICTLKESDIGFKMLLRACKKTKILQTEEFQKILSVMIHYYLRKQMEVNIITSKRIGIKTFKEHLYRRREITNYLCSSLWGQNKSNEDPECIKIVKNQ